MFLPSVRFKADGFAFRHSDWCSSSQRSVSTMSVVVLLEVIQLQFQIRSRPEEHPVQILSANCANQAFNEWVGFRNIWNCFEFVDIENSQVRLPLMKPIQRIVIRAEILRKA